MGLNEPVADDNPLSELGDVSKVNGVLTLAESPGLLSVMGVAGSFGGIQLTFPPNQER